MMIKKIGMFLMTGVLAAFAVSPAFAGSEHSLGKTLHKDHLVIDPVYLQPVVMAPAMPGINSKQADVHLEIGIHAGKDNQHGFPKGAWIPDLTVSYLIQKKGSDWHTFGTLMAMTAADGPHYGENVQLDGPGKYTASFKIAPPPRTGFLRHKSNATGVPKWWQPISHSWTFTYVGVGKKGGY